MWTLFFFSVLFFCCRGRRRPSCPVAVGCVVGSGISGCADGMCKSLTPTGGGPSPPSHPLAGHFKQENKVKEGGGGDIEALVDTPTHTAPTHPSLEQQGLLRRSVLVPSIPLSVLHSHTHPQPPSPPPFSISFRRAATTTCKSSKQAHEHGRVSFLSLQAQATSHPLPPPPPRSLPFPPCIAALACFSSSSPSPSPSFKPHVALHPTHPPTHTHTHTQTNRHTSKHEDNTRRQ